MSKSNADAKLIQRVQQNETIDDAESIFVFEECDMNAYLTWQYLPIALATILAILWESLDLTVRRLEPFRQLSLPEGDVDSAICLDYIGALSFTVPFRALRLRHYAVALSSSIFAVVATCNCISRLTGEIALLPSSGYLGNQLFGSTGYPCSTIASSSKQPAGCPSLGFYHSLFGFRHHFLLNYSCEYPVTTALQGRLAVARVTQAEKGNCDSGTP